MSVTTFLRRLFCLFIVGIGATLLGCNEVATPQTPNPTAAPFGPTLVLKANAPGLSAENIASLIAAPIEKQLAAFEMLPLVESICTEGKVEFHLHTKTGCNLKQVESLVRDRLALLKESLPQSVSGMGFQIQTKTVPLFVVAVYSPEGKHDTVSLSNVVKAMLLEQLAQVSGVGEVTVLGTSSAGDDVTVKQHPGIALLLSPSVEAKPTEIAEALANRLGELRAGLPEGILLTLPINIANIADPRETLLLLEMQLPHGTDASRRNMELRIANTRLRELPGIKNWVGFTRHPLEPANQNPCVVLHAATNDPAQAQKNVREAIQKLFAPNLGIKVQLKSFGKPDASVIRAAVSGPDVLVADGLAGKLVARLLESRSYNAEQLRSPHALIPRITVKLDRSKLAALGITDTEVTASLSETLNLPLQADQTREAIALPDNGKLNTVGGLASLRVKNAAGQEFALGDLAGIESNPTRAVVYRVNNQSAVLLAAQFLGEQNQKDAREQIAALFAAARGSVTLGDEYKLTWLED